MSKPDKIAPIAIVLLSGGQDSTTCLYWAMRHFEAVYTISFDYGQRHKVELEAAEKIARLAGVREHRVVPITSLSALGGTALLDQTEIKDHGRRGNLPNTFVPGRNILFLTVAAAWSYQISCHDLVIGTCQADYSGYPDCRRNTMDALEKVLRLGMDWRISIHTPLMDISKAESVHLAESVGAMEALSLSHTCYEGKYPPCGVCPACRLRAKGFAEAGVEDPLLARSTVSMS